MIISPDRSFTEQVLNKFALKSLPILIPFIYNKEIKNSNSDFLKINSDFSKIHEIIKKSDFSIISCARHLWKKTKLISDIDWINQNKNNDRFIKAFAKVCQKFPNKKLLLITFEYGPDVHYTKKLINDLNINAKVLWLPKMERKYLLNLISQCDVGAGEFYDIKNITWGATAMEVMAAGKPVIQAFDYKEVEFYSKFGINPPPIVSARTTNEIFNKLVLMINSEDKRVEISKKSREWFNQNMSIELASKWISLLRN
jgi:glycosyltransferase involved in cell wall biosynthesis